MDHYAGIDVSLKSSSVCVVDASGKIVREGKVASEPEALIAWFRSSGFDLRRGWASGKAEERSLLAQPASTANAAAGHPPSKLAFRGHRVAAPFRC